MGEACDEREHFDAIVVGVGAHGSAALYHLAKRGSKVIWLKLGHEPEPASHHIPGSTTMISIEYRESYTIARNPLRTCFRKGLLLCHMCPEPARGVGLRIQDQPHCCGMHWVQLGMQRCLINFCEAIP